MRLLATALLIARTADALAIGAVPWRRSAPSVPRAPGRVRVWTVAGVTCARSAGLYLRNTFPRNA